jgi:mRNA interferase MazF
MTRPPDLAHGQVWWADLDKVRPVVILTRGRVAPLLSRVLVAPVTSTARGLATEVVVGTAEGVREGSVANLDNSQLIPVNTLVQRAGVVSSSRWSEFCEAMSNVMAC